MEEKSDQNLLAKNVIKDPYIFEFLGISNQDFVKESKIETSLINHLQQFLMELG